jgi:hypothetical protein
MRSTASRVNTARPTPCAKLKRKRCGEIKGWIWTYSEAIAERDDGLRKPKALSFGYWQTGDNASGKACQGVKSWAARLCTSAEIRFIKIKKRATRVSCGDFSFFPGH